MRVSRNGGKIFWGLLFVFAAVYMVVGKIWSLPDISIFSLALTVLFVSILVKGLRHVNFWEILFPIAFLCIIYDDFLGITALTPWTVLGAAFFGSIGLSMIFRPKNGTHVEMFHNNIDANGNVTSEQFTGERIRFENNFGSAIKYINSDNFLKGDFENNFGSMSIYFDNAMIQAPEAVVNVTNHFGETKLFIPKEWSIVNNIDHSFGNVKMRGRYEGTSTCMLVLNGEANFGEIEINFI